MLKTFLQFMSLIAVLLSSYFLVKGALAMSPKDILNLSGTYWNSSPFAAQSYCAQKADSIIGTVLLLVSFFLQIWIMYFPTYADEKVSFIGVVLAFVICGSFLFIGLKISTFLQKYFYQQVLSIEKRNNK